MSNDIVMHAANLYKSYHQNGVEPLRILNDFSMSLKAGEVAALVGPSGSGKSTLLHILGLLDHADEGDLSMNGQSVMNLSNRQKTRIRRSSIGFIYQFHHLLPEFSAIENVMMPQLIAGKKSSEARDRAMTLLTQLKIDHRADHRPAKLSGGEQQRVAIARAIANDPQILLADEPTGNLDPETAEHVFDMFLSLAKDHNVTALIATHNMDLAKKMDRIIDFQSTQLG